MGNKLPALHRKSPDYSSGPWALDILPGASHLPRHQFLGCNQEGKQIVRVDVHACIEIDALGAHRLLYPTLTEGIEQIDVTADELPADRELGQLTGLAYVQLWLAQPLRIGAINRGFEQFMVYAQSAN